MNKYFFIGMILLSALAFLQSSYHFYTKTTNPAKIPGLLKENLFF